MILYVYRGAVARALTLHIVYAHGIFLAVLGRDSGQNVLYTTAIRVVIVVGKSVSELDVYRISARKVGAEIERRTERKVEYYRHHYRDDDYRERYRKQDLALFDNVKIFFEEIIEFFHYASPPSLARRSLPLFSSSFNRFFSSLASCFSLASRSIIS